MAWRTSDRRRKMVAEADSSPGKTVLAKKAASKPSTKKPQRAAAGAASECRPITGLIEKDEIDFAARDWHGACDGFHRDAVNRSKEAQRVMRVHRDPFEPIMRVLEDESLLAAHRKITSEILARMPDENRYPRQATEAVKSFLPLRLGMHVGTPAHPSSVKSRSIRSCLTCSAQTLATTYIRADLVVSLLNGFETLSAILD